MDVLSKLNFDDFYKFLVSIGLVAIVLGFLFAFFQENITLWSLYSLVIILSIGLIWWASGKWYTNQKLLDRKLKIECRLLEKQTSEIISQEKMIEKVENLNLKVHSKNTVALVEYKVDSVLPGTVSLDLVRDKRIWFWIANLEGKKYLAYIKIKLKAGNLEKELGDNYYGGKEPWKLNAFTGIHAPGLGIPDRFISKIRNGENLDVTINCEIKDENGKLVEKKLPVTYKYSSKNKVWYLEP